MLEGRVTHPELVVAGIHVINADRGLAEITDIDGNFQISVTVGERLVFSGVQYKKRELIISEEIFALEAITVYLEAFVNELDEVIVKPHQLSGSLASDISNVPKQINFDDVGIPGYKGVAKRKNSFGSKPYFIDTFTSHFGWNQRRRLVQTPVGLL